MATRNIPFPDKVRDMVLEVTHVRRQEYTPEQLCQLQKIIECKYFYWWCMDMKKEEYVMELFSDDFRYYLNGHLTVKDKLLQARNAKWCNKDMQTMHMGHQPMIWLIDENHARRVFQYEDHMCYYDDSGSCRAGWSTATTFVKGRRRRVAHPEAAHGLSRDGRQLPHNDGAQGLGAGRVGYAGLLSKPIGSRTFFCVASPTSPLIFLKKYPWRMPLKN